MDLFPLWNSLRIAACTSVLVFFAGIWAAYEISRLPSALRGLLDTLLTLPLVLPPTVCGFFILQVFGIRHPLGHFLDEMGFRLVMSWPGGVLAAFVVSFPLMYRTARGAFQSFDKTCQWSAQTLGLSDTYVFWHIRMPVCRQGIIKTAKL